MALVAQVGFPDFAFALDDDQAPVFHCFTAQQREPLAGAAQDKAGAVGELAK